MPTWSTAFCCGISRNATRSSPICEAALKEFEDVPYYWAVCAKYVIQAKMWRDADRGKAADLANQVVEKLGEQLPTGHVASKLLPRHESRGWMLR